MTFTYVKMRPFLLSTNLAETCPDAAAGALCQASCETILSQCQSACLGDADCVRLCTNTAINCINNCPCYANCPQGCTGCPSEFCESCEVNSEDPNWVACETQANADFMGCIVKCTPGDTECPAVCNREYTAALDKCPCGADCPRGCPCPDYDCAISTTDAPGTTGTTGTPSQCDDKENYPEYKKCEQAAGESYSSCLVACNHNQQCMTQCQTEYTAALDHCPCGSHCPSGCPCPSYDCDQPATSNTVLVFNGSYYGKNRAFLIDSSGIPDEDIVLDIEKYTDLSYACSVMWQNSIYVFGGDKYPTQISKLENNNGCSLHRIGELNISANRSMCRVGGGAIYICFESSDSNYSKAKKCHRSNDPLEPFTLIDESPHPHYDGTVGIGNGEFMALGHYDNASYQMHNKVDFYNFVTDEWTESNEYPFHGYVFYAPIVYHKNAYYVFGGTSGSQNGYDGLARMDAQTRAWKELAPGKLTHKRWGHAVVVIEESFLVIGGSGQLETEKCEYLEWGDAMECNDVSKEQIDNFRYWPETHYVPSDYCKTL